MLPDNPYSFVPYIIIVVAYLGSWVLMKKKKIAKPYFQFFWNTLMLIVLIPAVFCGYVMIVRYSDPEFLDIDVNFRYWHVTFALMLSSLILCHFLTRTLQYISPMRSLWNKKHKPTATHSSDVSQQTVPTVSTQVSEPTAGVSDNV